MDKYETNNIPKGESYTLVANARRRTVIRLLLDEPDDWDVDDLARAVAAHEQGCSREDVDEQIYERVLLGLLHSDLPKLADGDIVVFENKTVAAGEYIDELARLVE